MLPNCVAFAAAEADAARRTELFGGCGVAPTQLMGLPTSACSETDAAMPSEFQIPASVPPSTTLYHSLCVCRTSSLSGCISFTPSCQFGMAASRAGPDPCCCRLLCCCSAVSDACVEAGSLSAYSVHLSNGLCPVRGSQTITFRGVPCGPGNSLVQWEALSAPACGAELSRTALDPKQQADWVGQCGVPPMQISGLPTTICGPATPMQAGRRHRARHTVAPPHQVLAATEDGSSAPEVMAVVEQALARKNLATGESTTNWGMSRIGALAGQ